MTRSDKRAAHPREAKFSTAFRKDWERLSRSGRYDMRRLKQAVMLIIANDGPLGPEWRDHPLKGTWAGHRECHVGGNFLLVYFLDNDSGQHGRVVFVRAGTHSELFRE